MKRYFDFMAKYYPDGDKDSNFNTYGYGTAQLLVHVLKQCGDNLTRENVMKQAAILKDVSRPRAARHQGQHLADRLPRQQAASDDEVQRRALGAVRPDPGGCRPGGLVLGNNCLNDVMPGLESPAIHVLERQGKGVDGRVKPGHDGECGHLLRYLPKILPDRQHRVPDQP